MVKQLFALIKWSGTEDDGKFTAGVPIEWVKDFDYADYMEHGLGLDELRAIEWREKRKKPLGGWPVYDGYIVQISDTRLQLEQASKQFYVSKFAQRIIPIHQKNSEDEEDVEEGTEYRGIEESNTSIASNSGHENIIKIEKNATIPATGLSNYHQTEEKRRTDLETPLAGCSHLSKQLSLSRVNVITKKQMAVTLEIIYEELIKNQKMISSLLEAAKKPSTSDYLFSTKTAESLKRETKRFYVSDHEDDDSGSDAKKYFTVKQSKVEISPGSNVFVTHQQWKRAMKKETFRAMGLSLLIALFPQKILVKSNLAGGKSKLTGDNKEKKEALDPHIVAAIRDAVSEKFPKTYNYAALRIAINNKLSTLRRIDKKNKAASTSQ